MNVELDFPLTRAERAALGVQPVVFPASWSEYWELLGKAEFSIEYDNHKIIAMGYESNPHANIIFELTRILGNLFPGKNYQGFAENRPVCIPGIEKVRNPDIFLVRGKSELFEYSTGLNAETTPFLVVEVLSESTYHTDWEQKLPFYKSFPTVEHILYIESRFPALTLFTRTEKDKWDKQFINEPHETIQIAGQSIALEAIYLRTEYFEQ